MTPVIQYSVNNISTIPGPAFTIKNKNCLTRCRLSRNTGKCALSSERLILPLATSFKLLLQNTKGYPLYKRFGNHVLLATGTDVAIEESGSPVPNEISNGDSEVQSDALETSESSPANSDSSPAPAQSKKTRPVRKSEMPPVKNEELIPGAAFTGKVRSIQPFGAFVDFGAFTDGLVHVSRLSNSFVKDVASFVSVGQEVKVTLVEVNTETGRISLSMRESEDSSKRQQRKDGTAAAERARPNRKSASKPSQKKVEVKRSKFVKGQELEGTVKNLTRSGTFISLPEGEEGFLPHSEESDDGLVSMMGGSSLHVGQEVKVRVLRVTRGQVTLTMKKEDDGKLDSQLAQGVVHVATNPFVLAFRKNKDIAAFLDRREDVEKSAQEPVIKISEVLEGKENQSRDGGSNVNDSQDQPVSGIKDMTSVPPAADERVEEEAPSDETDNISDVTNKVEEFTETVKEEVSKSLSTEDTVYSEEVPSAVVSESDSSLSSSEEVADQIVSSEKLAGDEDLMHQTQVAIVEEQEAITTSEVLEGKENQSRDGRSTVNDSLDQPASGIKDMTSVPLSANERVEEEASSDETDIISDVTNKGEEFTENVKEEVSKSLSSESQISKAAPSAVVSESDNTLSSSEEVADEFVSSEKLAGDEDLLHQTQDAIIEAQIETPTVQEPIEGNEEGSIPDRNGSIISSGIDNSNDTDEKEESNGNDDPSQQSSDDKIKSSESNEMEVQENQTDGTQDKVLAETAASRSDTSSVQQVVELQGTSQQSGTVTNSHGSTSKEKTVKATISPALVKQLREETGAGMMDCKKALSETGGDIVKAQEYLRKKGLASAEKKASRATAEGRIGSYIHDSRIGVLLEVNCETDFVSRGEIFKELVDDLAMQVAACPQVQYLVTEDVPEEVVNKEKEIEMQKEDLLSKPEQIRLKIVEGRIRKRLEELALLEQPYIKNDKIVVKDLVKQTIATIGENIKVKRFVRYNLGEGLEKKSQDFAAEVAAQTAAKPASISGKDQSASAEVQETVQKPPTATISAALVKQLREETGAGMMDCKKALSETGGDLEKAQEYLRKKGLSSADKRSSRLAAEGRIGSYIHDCRIGVLIEVNCETDFVGRSEKFKELVDDLAMQVVACPQVQFVSIENIPENIVKKEKELEMQREDLQSKPENIRERIVEGRVSKRLGELALLEQPFIKDDNLLVKDVVKQAVAALGENIKVRRFVRFTLGETVETSKPGSEV